MRDKTGECADAAPATMEEFVEYIGPIQLGLYQPFVAEWATCSVPPYPKLGLVLFREGRMEAFQESWRSALDSGEIWANPDWSFGNGFGVTIGSLGVERLGLYYLWCEPVEIADAKRWPADVDGCVFAVTEHEH